MANGLYTRNEIARMTNDSLSELLGYYGGTGNVEGVQRVQDELATRYDDDEAEREAELAHEAEQERQQIMHDEMINDRLIEDGRWG